MGSNGHLPSAHLGHRSNETGPTRKDSGPGNYPTSTVIDDCPECLWSKKRVSNLRLTQCLTADCSGPQRWARIDSGVPHPAYFDLQPHGSASFLSPMQEYTRFRLNSAADGTKVTIPLDELLRACPSPSAIRPIPSLIAGRQAGRPRISYTESRVCPLPTPPRVPSVRENQATQECPV